MIGEKISRSPADDRGGGRIYGADTFSPPPTPSRREGESRRQRRRVVGWHPGFRRFFHIVIPKERALTMPSAPRSRFPRRLGTACLLIAALALAGCLRNPSVSDEAWKTLESSIQKEFDLLVKEFDQLDSQGDRELCQPVQFAVARFAVYQAVEERRGADMAQLARFIQRARRALSFSPQAPRGEQ